MMGNQLILKILDLLSGLPQTRRRQQRNFLHNADQLGEGYPLIRQQHSELCRSLRLGLFTFQYCGCAEIAVLNLLHQLAGSKDSGRSDRQSLASAPAAEGQRRRIIFPPAAEVIRRLDRQTAVLWGLLGTSTMAVVRYLEELGLGCICRIAPGKKDYDALTARSSGPQTCYFLATVWNRRRKPWKGMHTFLIERLPDRTFITYNTRAGKRHFGTLEQAAELCDDTSSADRADPMVVVAVCGENR